MTLHAECTSRMGESGNPIGRESAPTQPLQAAVNRQTNGQASGREREFQTIRKGATHAHASSCTTSIKSE